MAIRHIVRLFALVTSTCFSAASANAELIALWQLDEASSGPLSIGQIQDSAPGSNSSSNITGTAGENDPIWVTAGVPDSQTRANADGRAIRLDGLGDSISFGQGAANELRITGAFTMWGRVRVLGLGGASIYSKSSPSPNRSNSFVWNSSLNGSGSLNLSADGTTTNNFALAAPAGSYPLNTWLDFAAVFSPPTSIGANDGLAQLYRDGNLVASGNHDIVSLFDTSAPFLLGPSLPIEIEQFRVYNEALSQSAIIQLYAVPEPSAFAICSVVLTCLFAGRFLRTANTSMGRMDNRGSDHSHY